MEKLQKIMKVSKCCGAGFPEPGYPDTDLCGLCYEHTEAIEEEEPSIEVIELRKNNG